MIQAAQMEESGPLERKERSPEKWKQIAINEAASAVAAVNFPDLRNIEFVWSTDLSPLCVFGLQMFIPTYTSYS